MEQREECDESTVSNETESRSPRRNRQIDSTGENTFFLSSGIRVDLHMRRSNNHSHRGRRESHMEPERYERRYSGRSLGRSGPYRRDTDFHAPERSYNYARESHRVRRGYSMPRTSAAYCGSEAAEGRRILSPHKHDVTQDSRRRPFPDHKIYNGRHRTSAAKRRSTEYNESHTYEEKRMHFSSADSESDSDLARTGRSRSRTPFRTDIRDVSYVSRRRTSPATEYEYTEKKYSHKSKRYHAKRRESTKRRHPSSPASRNGGHRHHANYDRSPRSNYRSQHYGTLRTAPPLSSYKSETVTSGSTRPLMDLRDLRFTPSPKQYDFETDMTEERTPPAVWEKSTIASPSTTEVVATRNQEHTELSDLLNDLSPDKKHLINEMLGADMEGKCNATMSPFNVQMPGTNAQLLETPDVVQYNNAAAVMNYLQQVQQFFASTSTNLAPNTNPNLSFMSFLAQNNPLVVKQFFAAAMLQLQQQQGQQRTGTEEPAFSYESALNSVTDPRLRKAYRNLLEAPKEFNYKRGTQSELTPREPDTAVDQNNQTEQMSWYRPKRLHVSRKPRKKLKLEGSHKTGKGSSTPKRRSTKDADEKLDPNRQIPIIPLEREGSCEPTDMKLDPRTMRTLPACEKKSDLECEEKESHEKLKLADNSTNAPNGLPPLKTPAEVDQMFKKLEEIDALCIKHRAFLKNCKDFYMSRPRPALCVKKKVTLSLSSAQVTYPAITPIYGLDWIVDVLKVDDKALDNFKSKLEGTSPSEKSGLQLGEERRVMIHMKQELYNACTKKYGTEPTNWKFIELEIIRNRKDSSMLGTGPLKPIDEIRMLHQILTKGADFTLWRK